MEAVKYDRTVAEEAKLLSIQRKAKEISDREGITMAEATKQATLLALKRKGSKGKGGKGKGKNKGKSGQKSGAKKSGSLFDYIGEKLSGK